MEFVLATFSLISDGAFTQANEEHAYVTEVPSLGFIFTTTNVD